METSSGPAAVREFLNLAGIPCAAPKTAEFNSWQSSFTGCHADKQPSFIARPQEIEHVADVVTQCLATNTPLVVRGQGHDMFGRFTVLGAISVDLRDLTSVKVSPDKKTARVQGGASAVQVLEALQPLGLQVAIGTCGDVGFAGWSLVGGFGPYLHSYGLGAHQIVGAKVVDSRGKLVDADDRLLEGLRGGGGSLGIVVELTVKVYPLEEVQAGTLLFESSDIAKTVTSFFTNYNRLTAEHGPVPTSLALVPSVWMIPTMGLILTCGFVWNGLESVESHSWLKRVARLAEPMANGTEPGASVVKTSPLGYALMQKTMLPDQVMGRTQTASVSHFSEEVINTLATVSSQIPPDSAGGIQFHILRSNSPSLSSEVPRSVCAFREPVIVLELLGFGVDDYSAKKAAAWSLSARSQLVGLEDAVEMTYLALTSPEFVDLKKIYGDRLEILKSIKKEVDPEHVFKNTLPRLD